jgi:predicted ATPase/DNA-binding winged helix-turn-helix (wHTH) protein/Tfp pilus assembly protein PilF
MRKLYEIGELRLDPEAGVLTRAGEPVALGARAVAVLTALVSRANEYVPKAEIMDAAWPGLVVEEANLAVQISAIRRALAQAGGDRWIETLARRGYRFVGPVVVIAGGKPEAPMSVDRKRSNLPQVLTSFVGREREIAEIKRLLPTTRLLTLTGTGGIGKTRLAVQAAAEVLDAYRDGVWFVDLAPLTDPARVPSALAQVLGVKESAGSPLLRTLCDYLRAKQLLLVLDNCEHLLGACADLIDTLLRETARVNVFATSRESLRVAAECTYPVNVLPLPDPKAAATTIARSDAVQLFVDRARQHRPSFDLQEQRAGAVAAICVRLDGIPLALELAAARVAVLPVDQIVRLLDQRFRLLTSGNRELPRQQTLRAMLDWSYELLDATEQQLFAKLSVFAGGWTIAAAETVGAGETIARDDVVYLLIALIEKSLVVADEDGDRYRMLETVREYARERMAASGLAGAVRERHRDFFLALAEEAKPELAGAAQAEWLQRLEAEHDNLRSAIEWSVAEAGSGKCLRLCSALQQFWITRGHFSEGRQWCATALDKAQDETVALERAMVLNTSGTLAHYLGDDTAARPLHEESLATMRKLRDRRGIGNALHSLGNVALDKCEFASAQTLYEESLAIRRELGDLVGIAHLLHNLGLVAYDQGDYPAARALYEEALAIQRDLGDKGGISFALHNLAMVAFVQGDVAFGRSLYEESLAIKRELGDMRGIANTLNNLGMAADQRGDHVAARALYEESLAIKRDLGDKRGTANTLNNLGMVALELGDLAAARAQNEESLAIRRELMDRWGITNSLEGLAAIIAASGNSPRAARIWGAAERLRKENGSPRPPNEQPAYDRHVAAARNGSGDGAAFDRAWQEGHALTLEQAMELALEKSASGTHAHD